MYKSIVKKLSTYNTLFLEDESTNVTGILIFEINEAKSYIEIHYLCSMAKGYGKLLLDKIKIIAQKYNISEIILTPIAKEKVIQYYKNNGFKEGELLTMVYKVNGGNKTKKNNKKTFKKKHTKTYKK
jgi:hypothetical protein